MRIIQESRVPSHPGFFHLAYLAASSPIPTPQKGLLAAGIFLIAGGLILMRKTGSLLPSAQTLSGFFGMLAGAGLLWLLFFSFGGPLTGAPISVIMAVVLAQLSLGYLAVHQLKVFFADLTGDTTTTAKGTGSLFSAAALRKIWGPICAFLGFAALAGAFFFGSPRYVHPRRMTTMAMHSIGIKAAPLFADQVSGSALEEFRARADSFLQDGWHQPIQVRPSASESVLFELVSLGPDGILATADDIVGVVKPDDLTGELAVSFPDFH